MLRRHGHRKACGREAMLIRSLVQTGLEEVAWKWQEPVARGRLIAVQQERRPSATARRLIANEISLGQMLLGLIGARQRETAEPALRRLMSGELLPGIWR
jgi:hypothetical protein